MTTPLRNRTVRNWLSHGRGAEHLNQSARMRGAGRRLLKPHLLAQIVLAADRTCA